MGNDSIEVVNLEACWYAYETLKPAGTIDELPP